MKFHLFMFLTLNVHPPKGTAKVVPERVQLSLDSLSILYVIGEPKLGLQKNSTIFAFLKVSKTFIPRREVRKYTRWCPNDFLMVYCTSELKLEFQYCDGKSQKNSGEHIYCAGGNLSALRAALRTALRTGHQKSPLIFFKLKYDNKKDVLIPNMVLKSVRGFFIKTYEHFNFKIWEF